MLKLILLVLPLGLDTFAVSAALGASGLPERHRLRVSLVLSAFETAMPLIGLAIGHRLGSAIGGAADYVAAGALVAVGGYMLVADEEAEEQRVASLSRSRGLALLGLGVSVSLDELAMGFSIGLLHLSVWAAVILIGVQAFVVAQLGLRLGARLGESIGERAEKIAALALIALGVLIVIEQSA